MVQEDDPDLLSSTAIALGKCLRHLDDAEATLAALRPLLAHENEEVAESATLALGLSGSVDALQDLTSLASNNAHGLRLAQADEVPIRVRVRAFYALTLLTAAQANARVDAATLRAARRVLDEPERLRRQPVDLPIAALHALSALGHAEDSERAAQTLREALALVDGLPDDLAETVKAHAPVAVARLLRRGHARRLPKALPRLRARLALWRTRLDDLAANPPPAPPPLPDPPAGVTVLAGDPEFELPVARSILSAVGMTAGLEGAQGSVDEWTQLLVGIFESTLERQTRYLALLALAEIGEPDGLAYLVETLKSSEDQVAQDWCALAIGVHAAKNDPPEERRRSLSQVLVGHVESRERTSSCGPAVIALGLLGDQGSVGTLRMLAAKGRNLDELLGRVSIALALLGDAGAKDLVRDLYDKSSRRPVRAHATGIATTLLGDRSWIDLEALDPKRPSLASLAALMALHAECGGRDSLPALLAIAHDAEEKAIQRAIAVTAIGRICNPESRPWNTPIADHVAHRATPPTLSDNVSGVLDIE